MTCMSGYVKRYQLDRLTVRQSGIYSLQCPGYDAYECEFNSYTLKQFNMDMILFLVGLGILFSFSDEMYSQVAMVE